MRYLLAILLLATTATAQRFVKSVSSISQLLSLQPNDVNTNVFVGGYYTDNDGGGGSFRWNSLSLVATNLGTTFKSPIVPSIGRWERIYSSPLNVKWFGAKGDGSTDDTLSIKNSFSLGQSIYFPAGTFKVAYDDLATTYYVLLKVKSNMQVSSTEGAIINITGSNPGANSSLFGVDVNNFPSTNISFSGITIKATGATNSYGIMLQAPPDSAPRRIRNVLIENCTFIRVASAIYILQRNSLPFASTERQVNEVKIVNCFADGCIGSFVTADGDDILISNNTSIGYTNNVEEAYDAVSVTSGSNVTISGNTFSFYGSQGTCVNIRNNVNNFSGTRNVVIEHNIIHDCIKAISVITQAGEHVFGVSNVIVNANSIFNVDTGIIVESGAGDPNTPFSTISLTGNSIVATNQGILFNGSSLSKLENSSVLGNTIFIPKLGGISDEYILQVKWLLFGSVSGNTIVANNATPAMLLSGTFLNNVTMNSNLIYPYDPSYVSIYLNTLTDSTVSANILRGRFTITNILRCNILDNNNSSVGTVDGHVVGTYPWGLQNNLFTITSFNDPNNSSEHYNSGDITWSASPVAGGPMGYVCTVAGTPGTHVPFGRLTGTTGFNFHSTGVLTNSSTAIITSGAASPEGVITAVVGSIYLRTGGGAGTSFYVKESAGTPSTGWVGK